MQGYPKVVAVKQDYINLLNIPEYKAQALSDLQKLADFNDEPVKKSVGISQDDESYILVDNPNPIYKQKGFATKQEVRDLIIQYS